MKILSVQNLTFSLMLLFASTAASQTFTPPAKSIDGEFILSPSQKRPIYISSNKIICKDCDSFTIDGQDYLQLVHNNKVITIAQSRWDDYASFLVAIGNRGDSNFTFDPALAVVDYTVSDAFPTPFNLFKTIAASDPEALAKRTEKAARWKNAVAAGLAQMQNRTIVSETSGNVTVRDTTGQVVARGTYSGTTETTVPDQAARRQTEIASARREANASNTAAVIRQVGFKKNTIFAKEVMQGFIYFKLQKFRSAYYIFPIDGFEYVIMYKPPK